VISVVVPVHDEERSVALLYDELRSALEPLDAPWEVIFVDDGSTDGTWSALTAIATSIGPALGGWLVQAVSWRAVFLLNLPIAATVIAIALRKIPETRGPSPRGLDVAGALLATVGLGALVFGLIEAPGSGWGHPRAWGTVAGGILALAGFVAVELRSRHPMVAPALFRIRTFAAANLLTLFLYAALSATLFFLPFDLIQARGYSPAAAGAAVLPLVVLIFLLSRPAGAIADRLRPASTAPASPAAVRTSAASMSFPGRPL